MQIRLNPGRENSVAKLVVLLMLSALTACGGQPPLEVTQAVVQSPAPVVPDNTEATVLWRATSSGSKLQGVQFEPVINGNTVFTASRSGHIEGFDLDTGKRVFSRVAGAKLANGVGVNTSSVLAVSTEGEVIALNRADGEEKWRYNVGHSISAAPALNDQVVAVRTVDGQVLGINASNGKQIWAIERPVAALSVGLDAPGLVAAEGLITGFSSGRVVASNIYNGTTFWEKRAFRPGGKNEIERLIDIDAPPVLAGQITVIGSYQGGVVAYRLRDGEEVWRSENTSTRKPMALSEKYLGLTGPESDVSLMELDSGKVLWKRTQLRGHGLSSPAIAERSVVVGGLDSVLYFFNIEDGLISSRFNLGSGPITSMASVDQGILVYSAGSGRLTMLNRSL